jgi:chemotaxis protein methyltransferase CheR
VDNISITREELPVWSRYVQEICGVYLDQSKGYLLETRLGGLFRETGTHSFSELYYKVKSDFSNGLRRKIIDAITTNETSFFRDASPFELLQHKLIPEIIDRRGKNGGRPLPIRIWSAACSTGQEVYSTAIVIKELLGDLRNYDVRLLGTDISDKAVAQASYGHFTRQELERGMPPDKIARHFLLESDRWKIRDEIRALTTFRTMNLLEPFSFPAPFDIVFCRNVAIYFTEPDKIRLFRNIGKYLSKDGCLIIGSTESISGLCPEFEPKRYLRAVFYQFKNSG